MRKALQFVAAMTLALTLPMLLLSPASAQDDGARIHLIHGIPDVDVDVEASVEVEVAPEAEEPATPAGARRPRTPIDDRSKPVTDGFDWVTEMPAKGSSTPLPSRARAEGANDSAEQPPGAVATVEAPPAALPRRRSTLRSPDDDRR